VLRAPDTTARGNHGTFTHQGITYELMRFYPGDEPAQALSHHRATAEILKHSGSVILSVEVTAHTTHLMHIAWIDNTGELVGTWCPADYGENRTRTANLRSKMLGEDLTPEAVQEADAVYESMRAITQFPWSAVEA
jgi:hypothetical protein